MGESNLRTASYCFFSSQSLDGDLEDLPQPEQSTHVSVTAVLNYCKSKILNPYLRLLSITGLRSLVNHHDREPCIFWRILNCIYALQLIIMLIAGYVLQYMACFRRDRGFCYKLTNETFLFQSQAEAVYEQICHGPILFTFFIPSCLHLVGYLYAFVVFRHSDDDQLPVLMERVFLSSASLPSCASCQKKLVKMLWFFVALTAFWMSLSLTVVNIMMSSGNITFKWLNNQPYFVMMGLKVALVVCTLWHDIVQGTIVSNYCLQVELLTTYLHFLRLKLLQHPIQPLEWIRNIEQFKKMLSYINYKIAPSVCILTIMNISCGVAGLMWLFNFDRIDKETLPILGISVLNVVLWICIALVPFIQASRLTRACDILRCAGQEVRSRPFVHQDTPLFELDAVLLYTSSLNLSAKLYCVPITGRYLCLFFTLASISVLVLDGFFEPKRLNLVQVEVTLFRALEACQNGIKLSGPYLQKLN